MIPLFDSLAHPTLTGTWPTRERDATVETLVAALAANGFSGACAVGLAGLGDYTHERFAELCRPYGNLVPIAGFDPIGSPDIRAEIRVVRELGYRGIKLHPRLSRFTLRHPRFIEALAAAQALDVPVFLCTYFHSPLATYPSSDPLYDLVEALKQVPDVRLMLVHGGDVELMRYVQLARHNPNILVDISYTLMKYAGSSLDSDIRYLFSNFWRRICVGVDHPEFAHVDVRARFDDFASVIGDTAAQHVASLNLQRFLGLTAGT